MATPEKRLSTGLNARSIGSGKETIVLCHGFGTDQSIWHKIIPLLAESYTLVVFDWPFSGAVTDKSLYEHAKYTSFEPYADDLITVIDEMDLNCVTFVGHSMSAMIGCIASIKRPHLFNNLILVTASPRYINTDDYFGGFERSSIDEMVSTVELQYESWCSAYAPIAVDKNDGASVEKFLSCLKSMDSEVAVSLAKTVFYSDYRDMLEKVETPCTIIQSSNDMAVPVGIGQYLEKKIKGVATLQIIDMIGHFPQLTAHLKLVELVKAVVGI
ncbi:probable strigolactone esterase DAD2 [Vigna radiata var. radiata]|uniref:Probable strigolactone esterase DAD2 n=1 Tax=Vigna radiata var. radiata TaxID=3916 RepID=A0A1S3UJE4_VIGRR|nr:probable strigolactone esterase DAD2 [Vigna radiata var. radiata]